MKCCDTYNLIKHWHMPKSLSIYVIERLSNKDLK